MADIEQFMDAIQQGDNEQVRAMMDEEPTLVNQYNQYGYTPLHYAGYFGHVGLAESLLAQQADVHARTNNDMNNQPLHATVAGNNAANRPPIVELLIAAGADVNARQEGGFTPLHGAAQNGDAATMRLLLAAGADPAATADDGRDSRTLAEESGDVEAIALLAEATSQPVQV